MKRSKLFLVGAFALAVGLASFTGLSKPTVANLYFNSPTPCHAINCSSTGTITCTAIAGGLAYPDPVCVQPLVKAFKP